MNLITLFNSINKILIFFLFFSISMNVIFLMKTNKMQFINRGIETTVPDISFLSHSLQPNCCAFVTFFLLFLTSNKNYQFEYILLLHFFFFILLQNCYWQWGRIWYQRFGKERVNCLLIASINS